MTRPPQSSALQLAAIRLTGLAALALTLAGCATLSPDGGFGAVEKATADRLGTFEFACLIAGHYAAGMVGTIIVTSGGRA